jgi:hypothetical protein
MLDVDELSFYSLSVEELAFIYYLLNSPEAGERLLRSTYREIEEEQYYLCLTAGRNALLAKDLITDFENNVYSIVEDLQRAVSTTLNFDQLITLYKENLEGTWYSVVHLNQETDFAYHFNYLGAVHDLIYGSQIQMANLANLFFDLEDLPGSEDGELMGIDHSNLTMILQSIDNPAQLSSKILEDSGWNAEEISAFENDLRNRTVLGICGRGKSDYENFTAGSEDLPEKMLIFLVGAERNWIIRADGQAKKELSIQAVSGETMINSLGEFLLKTGG